MNYNLINSITQKMITAKNAMDQLQKMADRLANHNDMNIKIELKEMESLINNPTGQNNVDGYFVAIASANDLFSQMEQMQQYKKPKQTEKLLCLIEEKMPNELALMMLAVMRDYYQAEFSIAENELKFIIDNLKQIDHQSLIGKI